MTRGIVGAGFVIAITFGAFCHGEDRYFFSANGKAYYCERPAVRVEGCYVVCDRPNVVRIDSFPVITSVAADAIVANYAGVASSIVSHPTTESCCCEPSSHVGCTITVHGGCDCSEDCLDKKICGSSVGHLPPPEKETEWYYSNIIVIYGYLPVPKLKIKEKEQFHFSPKRLDFDCDEKPGGKQCVATACVVDKRSIKCFKKCEKEPKDGYMVLAVRKLADNRYVADVFVGNEKTVGGKENFLSYYPSNLLVLHDRTEKELNDFLKGPTGSNPVDPIDLKKIAEDKTPFHDLVAMVHHPCKDETP